jgi:DNA-binding SARP family transcriptional activator
VPACLVLRNDEWGAAVTGDAGLRIGVLGPLRVTQGSAAVWLPRGRAAALLAVLAMSAGRPVSNARLAGLLWDDDQPEHSRASLHTVVARLRGLVPGAVVTTGDGYLLQIDPEQVDLLRFRRLVREAGAAPDAGSAIGLFDQALGLWRGEPLADLKSAALKRDVVPGLTDEYLSAVQQHAELELAAGQPARVIAQLRPLAALYPLREPLWGQLMRALAGVGRPAEAIGEYHRAREVLAVQLGLDPSPELQDLYGRLLRADRGQVLAVTKPGAQADASAAGLPRRLPADTGVFTGRQAELARLLALGEQAGGASRGPGAVVISAIDGMAGVGKTALAVHAAHQLARRFADGQLYIDLHGYTQGYPPRTADQALEAFLRAMGVPPQRIPRDTEERAALYRERLAGTRTLIVLDNASDEAQVRPLIPADAGCLVLITSRRKLKSLDDARIVAVDVLPEPDAVALLGAVAGPGRVDAGDPGAAEVVALCGRLPLAVRIAGALLRNRPAWSLADLAGRLCAAHTRLDALADGDRDLAAVFGLSDQNLGDDQRRLYRHLGLIPGPEIDAYAAAALAGTNPATADQLLQELVDHNLLLEPAAGRYAMHDLIRAHARTQADRYPMAQRGAGLGRLLAYYQHTALRADASIARYAQPGPTGPAPGHAPALPDADTARAWLRAERANLGACLRYAVDRGLDEATVALSAGLANLLRTDGPWPQAIALQSSAAAAAARLGDRRGQARALTELGKLHGLTDDYLGAEASLRAALELHQETGDKPGQAHALTELANMQRLADDWPDAEASLRVALELHQETGDKAGRAHALIRLGMVRQISGDYPGTKASLRAALELNQETGDKASQAHALTQLMDVQSITGEYEDAIRNGESALVLIQDLGNRLHLANTLSNLGRAQRLTSDYESAASSQRAALDVFRELGNRLGQANALTELAEVMRLTGEHEAAANDLEQAIGIFRGLGSRGSLAWALNYYAAVIADTGDSARAIAVYRDALQLAREVRHPDDEAIALQGLGQAYLRAGELQAGPACLHQALEIYRRLGLPAAEQVARQLAEIEPSNRTGVAGCAERGTGPR